MNFVTDKLIKSWPFLLGLILGLWSFAFSLTGWDLSFFPGDLGDARFNTYLLEHGHKFLTGQEPSLWAAPFFYPEPAAITFSDNLIGTVPVYSIFRGMGASPTTSFQWWFITLAALNYSTCYYFLKWLFKNRYAAVLGAFIFAFSLALQSQMTHAQVFPRMFIPLAIWMLLLFHRDLKAKYLFFAGLFLVLQFYAGIYLGFLLFIPFGVVLLFVFGLKRKLLFQRLKELKWLLFVIGGAIINLFLLILLMGPYYQRSKEVGDNSYEAIVGTLPTLRSFFYSQDGSLFWNGLSTTGGDYPAFWDHQIFPGGVAILSLLLVVLLLIFRKRVRSVKDLLSPQMWILIISGGLTFLFFIRFQGYSFYQLIHHIPGFGSMRSLTRIINVELLFFALFVSFVAVVIFKRYENYTKSVFILFLGIILADNYFTPDKTYRTEKVVAQQRIDQLIDKMQHLEAGELISYEPAVVDDPSYFYQLDAMLASQSLDLKCVNGYSGNSPKGFHVFWHELSEESRKTWFESVEFVPEKLHVIK